jgi:hypothetical protein
MMAQGAVHIPDEEDVRSTLRPRTDEPAAKLSAPPEWNETATYAEPLNGLAERNLGGYITPSERYRQTGIDRAGADYESRVNRQVSSAGRAARLEDAGVWGHGTMMRTESIEPVIREGASFGEDYFEGNSPGVQSTMGVEITGQIGDLNLRALTLAQQDAASHQAAQAAAYTQFLGL